MPCLWQLVDKIMVILHREFARKNYVTKLSDGISLKCDGTGFEMLWINGIQKVMEKLMENVMEKW